MSRREPEIVAIFYTRNPDWAMVGNLAVYPREDGTFSIGRRFGVREYRDLADQTGFENRDAAIAQADWLVNEAPDLLRGMLS